MEQQLIDIGYSTSYYSPIPYISGNIIEYDIQAANITMLKKYHLIDDEYYFYLKSLPKIDREIAIGLKIKEDKSYYTTIKKGITDAKLLLFEKNDIKAYEIVRVANDAVYINRAYPLKYHIFDDIVFNMKSVSSVMLKIQNIIFQYNNKNGIIDIDVKGLGDNMILHQNYMISFIATVIQYVEQASIQDAINFISNFYQKYVKKELDIGFYRELNSASSYRTKSIGYGLSSVTNLNNIDINYNASIIRELWQIILMKYQI